MERKRTEYTITNFYGSFENSQIQQQTKDSIQIKSSVPLDLESISEFIREVRIKGEQIGLRDEEKEELESELISVEAQTKSPKLKNIIVKEGLKSIRTILEGAGGGVAATLLSKLGEIIF